MSTICNARNSTSSPTRKRSAKRVVLAGRFKLAGKVADHFRTKGWEVYTVTRDHDVHAAAAESDPHAIVLQEVAGDESGYLACVKLRHTQPDLRLVVLGTERTAQRERFAAFVGAEFVTEADLLAMVC